MIAEGAIESGEGMTGGRELELSFYALERGHAASPNRDMSANGTYHRVSKLWPLARRRRENICAYILRTFRPRKSAGGGRRVARKRLFLAKLRPRKSRAILAPALSFAPIFATEFCTD
jgi:hypothetical protein